ncbi:hypothetical protein [Enterococcus mundtii]|uniref:hypothetical protein n=2 Tax=Enterococcus TaxID=1350 RepID=UPI0008EA4BC9|nr:hypothetical protein [Enterococcus mundtii]MDB7086178.1 hypothetical protein [Enterococcus mundtii]NBA62303.1 hypothetical protein [Enterococcus mundtii]SFM36223.1 hypothetical protein SAMN04487758_1235 [Enterococcus mundtii]STD27218.1 Uncharacterised protein [Enterococcus mundtii]
MEGTSWKASQNEMTNRMKKYIVQLLVIFSLVLAFIGLVEFLLKGNKSILISTSGLGYVFGVPFLSVKPFKNETRIRKIQYAVLLFLCFYLPPKIVSSFEVERFEITRFLYARLMLVGILILCGVTFTSHKNKK